MVSYRPRSDARYVGSPSALRFSFLFPKRLGATPTLCQSVNQSTSLMSISSYASDSSVASNPHSYEFSLSDPSRQSGMVQPVVQEMLATVHAAGSSLLGLFSSCTTFDSTASGQSHTWTLTVTARAVTQSHFFRRRRGAGRRRRVKSQKQVKGKGGSGRGGRPRAESKWESGENKL
eukprot:scaffold19113_cov98-Isochrysis_galbana.AAC.6